MDPARDFAYFIECGGDRVRGLSQHIPQLLRSRIEIACGRAELQRERGQLLLRPVVQIPLNAAAAFVCGRDNPGPRIIQLRADEGIRDCWRYEFREACQPRFGILRAGLRPVRSSRQGQDRCG
jgi:hypothetical protein